MTKVGAKRGQDKSWLPAFAAEELERAVEDNQRNLGLETLDVVNLRVMIDPQQPAEGSIAEFLRALADLQRPGLIRGIGVSNSPRTKSRTRVGSLRSPACRTNIT